MLARASTCRIWTGSKREKLEADIAEAMRRPISRGPISSPESLAEFAARVSREGKLRQKRLHQALLRHLALIVRDRRGRSTLLLSSGEMSNPQEGHITRRSVARLAQDLARDLSPDRIEPASEEQVTAWVSTPEYVDGSERVLEMQRRNR